MDKQVNSKELNEIITKSGIQKLSSHINKGLSEFEKHISQECRLVLKNILRVPFSENNISINAIISHIDKVTPLIDSISVKCKFKQISDRVNTLCNQLFDITSNILEHRRSNSNLGLDPGTTLLKYPE